MIYILSGHIETGKTKAIMEWVSCRNDVFGILSPRYTDNKRYFFNISTSGYFPMETSAEHPEAIPVGRYYFLPEAFSKANKILTETINNVNSGYLIIDEIGKLELSNKGLHKSAVLAIEKTLTNSNLHSILIVRTTLVEKVKLFYQINDCHVITKEELSTIS